MTAFSTFKPAPESFNYPTLFNQAMDELDARFPGDTGWASPGAIGGTARNTARFSYLATGGAQSSTIGIWQRNADLTGANQVGILAQPNSSSAATGSAHGIESQVVTQAGSYTCADVSGAVVFDAVKGSGVTITVQTGFWAKDQAQGSTNYGFRGEVSSGANKWNAYFDGTAQNYFAGVTGIGIAASATAALALAAGTTGVASLRVPHGAAPSSPVNGDIWTTTAGLFVRINGATVGPLS